MYCANCGMWLPDWAHYCERCGSRVDVAPASDDPLDQIVPDDVPAEPLWDEGEHAAAEAAFEQGATQAMHLDVSDGPSLEPADDRDARAEGAASGQTVMMSDAQLADAAGEELAQADDAADFSEDDLRDEAPVDTGDVPADDVPADDADAGDAPVSDETQLMEAPVEDDVPADEVAVEDDVPADEAADEAPAEDDQAQDAPEEGADQDVEAAKDDEPLDPYDVAAAELARNRVERQVIDVGEDDGWESDTDDPPHYVVDPWRDNARPSDRMRRTSKFTSLVTLAIVAAAMLLGFAVAFALLGGNGGQQDAAEEQPVAKGKYVSAGKAAEIIASLDGWWRTDRTFDGRYWHFTGGLMETYAADGKLAREVLLDPESIEHMSSGPGGIEGAGCYLRDIAFYLLDDDPDTLHALANDGSADEDANLLRSEAPAFVGDGSGQEQPVANEGPSEEYILPESSTRVYDASELEGLSDHDLFVARNEIYARHGYVFEGGELSEYFSSKSWYQPSEVFNEGEITDIERQNVAAILSVEQSRGSRYV